jgi:hypothetical protein
MIYFDFNPSPVGRWAAATHSKAAVVTLSRTLTV